MQGLESLARYAEMLAFPLPGRVTSRGGTGRGMIVACQTGKGIGSA